MKFLTKVKDWFIAHKPTKRRLIQLYAALLTNAHVKGFVTGDIYKGKTKNICAPGLNCYSCPGAVGACPLGALQASLAHSDKTVPAYIFGILILFGVILGRMICSFLCPFGLIQELLYKIRTPKLRKSRFTRILSYFKYVLLALVIALPILFAGIPAFCQYVCPAGMVEGAIPLLSNATNNGFYAALRHLFTWKFCVAVVVIVASIFIYRFMCRFICPLGAIYSFFNRISFLGVKLDKNKCIDCGLCIQGCKMDVRHVGDHECIMCGECISVCPVQAISWKGSQIFLHPTSPLAQPAVPEGEKVSLLELAKSNAGEALALSAQAPALSVAEPTIPVEAESPVKEEAAVEEVAVEETAVEESVQQGDNNGVNKGKGSRLNAIKSAFKKPRFVVEFVAWVVALAVLITALVCFNLPEKKLDTLPEMTFTTYTSASGEGGKEYVLSSTSDKVRVIYFWRTDMEEGHETIKKLPELKQKYSLNVDLDIIAVHTMYSGTNDVQAFINAKGWDKFDITFLQDTGKTNAYMHFGGDTSVPEPLAAVVKPDGGIIPANTESCTLKDIEYMIMRTQAGKVYKVGDMCPLIELEAYCGKQTFSTYESRGKVTVINFWYTGCIPCKNELPEFNEVFKKLDGEINMVAVHNHNSIPPEGVQGWLDSNEDKNGLCWSEYSLTFAQDTPELDTYLMLGGRGSFPITIVVNAEGYITYVSGGECSEEALMKAIAEAKN